MIKLTLRVEFKTETKKRNEKKREIFFQVDFRLFHLLKKAINYENSKYETSLFIDFSFLHSLIQERDRENVVSQVMRECLHDFF